MKLAAKQALIIPAAIMTMALAGAVPASAATPGGTGAQAPQEGPSTLGELSIPCGKPPIAGRANFSYNPGSASVTVYYNNHCNHAVPVQVLAFSGSEDQYTCILAPPHTKSSKKVSYGLAGSFQWLKKGCNRP
ncbi:hypothetical protein FE391_39740 [Nonomuraea sp. KC401]|uniref:hypothetical protein n=1 Tax=unclassified Nonomuraea TaxID=2593643 RepID=UPI0010FF13D1|nr:MULTISPECIES: hypothetical protein [unclassified Nonomuraea]NBE93312.1 hypothetical protein [Nonomuraea sp. K271]TLF56198.1 hypothetical protein FE391_39740 [Nonomuraea sp. KC401]